MDSTGPATAILPIDLGTAAAYDQSIFPLAYYDAEDNFEKGVVLIRATLEEMGRIRDLGVDLDGNGDFIFNTRLKLEELDEEKAKLQDKNKTLNPFKAFLNYRAARLFHAATKKMFLQTKRTSERIRRDAWPPRVVRNTQMRMVDGRQLPPGVVIGGIAVDLPDGYNDAARQTINDATETMIATNPFQDNSRIPQLGEDEHAITLAATESVLSHDERELAVVGENRTSVASSDSQRSTSIIQNYYHFHNSIVATKSNLTAPTVNQGSHLHGSSVTQHATP